MHRLQIKQERIAQIELLQLRFDFRTQPLVAMSRRHEVDLVLMHLASLELRGQPVQERSFRDFIRLFGRGFHRRLRMNRPDGAHNEDFERRVARHLVLAAMAAGGDGILPSGNGISCTGIDAEG